MNNTIGLVPKRKKESANEVMTRCIESDQYLDVIVVGFSADGQLLCNHSALRAQDIVFTLEALKHKILQGTSA